MSGKTVDLCVGNVEIIYRADKNDELHLNYLATCSLKGIKDDADKVTLKNKDETTTEIGANSCIFECKDLSAAANYLVTFVYTDGNGATSGYLPSTPLVSDLPDVISIVSMPPISVPTTTLGIDGADSTTIVYVPGLESAADGGSNNMLVNPNVPPPENVPEKQTEDSNSAAQASDDQSDENKLVTQVTSASPIGGCSLIRITATLTDFQSL